MNEIMFRPPQCKATRKPRFVELLRYYVLGRTRGFDPVYEMRCCMYHGHEKYGHHNPRQAMHEDITGYRWPARSSDIGEGSA
jgi:hypothetical protein